MQRIAHGMGTGIWAACLVWAVALGSGCGDGAGVRGDAAVDPPPDEAARGRVVAVAFEEDISVAESQAELASMDASMAQVARYPVYVYRIVYETIDPHGDPTTASGLVAVPRAPGGPLPLVSYQHGTAVYDHYREASAEARVLPLLFASTGYLFFMPDYLGLEESPGLHPYVHADSLATSAIDGLRAVKTWASQHAISLNDQLFALGYSEGGYSTMALARAIEADHRDEFTLTAFAPMAGPYDLSGVMVDYFLQSAEIPNPYFLSYVILAYDAVYGLYDSLAEVFSAPYAEEISDLFDGSHRGSEISDVLPTAWSEFLTEEFISGFRSDPQDPLRLALAENDVHDWAPEAPVHLYHCSGDEDVPFENSERAYEAFVDNDAEEVELIDLGNLGHMACAPIAVFEAKQWFDSLRR